VSEHNLIEALEARIAGRIDAIERQTEDAIAQLRVDADALLKENESHQRALAEEAFLAHQRERKTQVRNEVQAQKRKLQFEAIESILGDIGTHLAGLPETPDYAEIWPRLLREAREAYARERTDPAILRVAERDRGLAERHGGDGESVELDPAMTDGVQLVSPDGRFRVVNTFQSRFRKGRGEFALMIAESLHTRMST
jgi:vacuolar-type H+-ATPase subunit E/Vma4